MAAAKIDNRSDMYFKLVATSLGCLESVLTNFKLPPLREAQLSLRYAQILYEETENHDDAERVLTKAIDTCERNKFLDLKYTLQLLLACVLYQSKPKAAIKDLQSMLEEIEAYKHTVWGYAARYQLAMFYLSAAGVRDLHNAINHMEKLSISANANGDRCIAAFADVICALLHLQTSSPEAVSSSQQYLAKARALSTNDEVASIDQIMFMMELADLCCSIREYHPAQCDVKRRRMQEVWTAIMDKGGWMRDGDMMLLPVGKSSLRGVQLQLGGLVREEDGKSLLPFSWMETEVAEAWGFLLCAITKAHTNASDGKAEQFIEHGLQRTRDATTSLSGRIAGSTTGQQKILECRFLVELAFLQCQKGEWDKAEEAVNTISKVAEEVRDGFPQSMISISQYLRGTIHQGSGDLDAAVGVYQAPMFDLGHFIRGPEASAAHHKSHDSETETIRNIAILAAMNRLLIINDPLHPQYQTSSAIVEQLNILVKASQDKNIQASYTLIHSLTAQAGILRSKQSLIAALNSAKAISNGQITALVLMTMHQKHFLGVTDEHAVKCVKATSMQMRNWGNPMWMHVTAGVEAEALEFAGKGEEAEGKLAEAARRAEGLPGRIREKVAL